MNFNDSNCLLTSAKAHSLDHIAVRIEEHGAPNQIAHIVKLTSDDLKGNYLKNIDGQNASVLYGQCNELIKAGSENEGIEVLVTTVT